MRESPEETPSLSAILFVAVSELTDNTKILNLLEEIKVKYVGQLLAHPLDDLLSLQGVGRLTIQRLRELLAEHDLQFTNAPAEWIGIETSEFEKIYRSEIRASRQLRKAQQPTTSLADDINYLVADVTDDRNRAIIKKRYGWSGAPPATLQEIADEFGGLTRERVRQICDRFENRVSRRQKGAPAVARAIAYIIDAVPADEQSLIEGLNATGLTTNGLSVVGILNAGRIVGSAPKLEMAEAPYSRFWVTQGGANFAKAITQIARRAVSRVGISNIETISDEIEQHFGFRPPVGVVDSVLRDQSGYARFDNEPGWFWFSTRRNRLHNVIRKVFAVSNRASSADLRAAIKKARRLEGFAPPVRILAKLAQVFPEFETDGHFITLRPGTNTEGWITGAELAIVEAIRRRGGISDRLSLQKDCLAVGMNDTTFDINLHATPTLQNLGRGVFALFGLDFSEGEIAHHRLSSSSRPVIDFGWTPNGAIQLRLTLTEHMRHTGFFPIPSQIRDYLSNSVFDLSDSSGALLGVVLKTNESQGWSVKKLLSKYGGEAGDTFDLIFDLERKTAVISFASAEEQEVS